MDIRALHEAVLRQWASSSPPFAQEARLKAALAAPGMLYYRYLYTLVRILQPGRILELGTQSGLSALCMLSALPEAGRLITVDSRPASGYCLRPFRSDPRLHQVIGNDLDRAIYGDLDLAGLDVLFIDTEHTYTQATQEWCLYRPCLRPGAIVVCDDIHLNPGMERFWRELPAPKLDTGDAIHASGWGLCGYRADPTEADAWMC
ncbi:MAG: class I SAM-dependent methyltransferase [Armatimonadetes bacterium]|nr:class I SAM-dependent methyltransferase [Armatimonadota bacterium]